MPNDDMREKPKEQPRRARRVTASDVAEAAGVSRPAVSRAFTPGAYLDEEKRTRIMRTALKLGYRPNALAASLSGSRTNLVGIISGNLHNHYDAEFVAVLVSRLNAANKWPLVLSGSETVTEQSFLSILNYPLDALIIRGGSIQSSLIETCTKLNIPVIFSGHVVTAPFTDSVCCRNADGAALAIDALLAKGRKRFAFIGGPDGLSSSDERLQSARARLKQAGLDLETHIQSDYTFSGGRSAVLGLLADHQFDALVCANDSMALGAVSAVRETPSLSVPDDISVIGFDDIPMASWPDFQLTTVRNPIDETIEEILRLLDARLEDPEKPNEVSWIDPVLVERMTH